MGDVLEIRESARKEGESVESQLSILCGQIGQAFGVSADELRRAQLQGFKGATARALAISIAAHCFPSQTFAICRHFNLKAHEIQDAQEWVEMWARMNPRNKAIHTNALALIQNILFVNEMSAIERGERITRPCDTEECA